MKKTVSIIPTPTKSEWTSYRQKGIGGSEVASALGVNPYFSNVELFYQKLGLIAPQPDNFEMLRGRLLEPIVVRLWQYWSGTKELTVKNFNSGNVVRRARKVNGYMVNSKYPHLLSSPDRLFTDKVNGPGVLEVKTTRSFVIKKWAYGIQPWHVYQLQSYLMITEREYGESATFVDGSELEVLPFVRHNDICKLIDDGVGQFHALIEKARPLAEEIKQIENMWSEAYRERYRILKAELDRMEPDADHTPSYQEFLKERYRDENNRTMKADRDLIHMIKKFDELRLIKTEAEKEMNAWASKIQTVMNKNGVNRIDLGALGYASWLKDSRGHVKFTVKFNEGGDED